MEMVMDMLIEMVMVMMMVMEMEMEMEMAGCAYAVSAEKPSPLICDVHVWLFSL